MASEVSVLTVQLPAEHTSTQLDTRQFTKLRFPSSLPQQPQPQQLHPHHQHRQLRPADAHGRRHDLLRPSDSPRSRSPRGDRHHHDPSAPAPGLGPGMPIARIRSREKLLPTPPGMPTQRYYRPRPQHHGHGHGQPSKPSSASSSPGASPPRPRPISYSSAGSQYSDPNQREPSSTSSSPLSRTPVSASELDHPPTATSRPKSNGSTSNHSTASSSSSSAPKNQKVEYHTPPLTNSHFSCYHFHKTFVRSPNVLYPLTCMTCLKADQELRWRCVFCCLRICGDCLGGIKACKDRSLIEFMEKLVMDLEAAGSTPTEEKQEGEISATDTSVPEPEHAPEPEHVPGCSAGQESTENPQV
ncbi:hypothetical protein MGYG_05044 [Nannizzia gypsea CBS 118893]|uniref:Uncharacterized protein n=1 Tax=Arthroderma gypseum (strain ATCC MYA-4604 / CBS 118893) TaxID=535722 RepID=E4UY79_ARTGP|nr:hypothetical protein MGYG_05044 [Nannizzia gypsea CBS 118893]EFR02042.1 hypothetical protein MGYG_05044 [Nannizzia gypsea CBS 118893]